MVCGLEDMVPSLRRICRKMTDAPSARLCESFDAVLNLVFAAYPEASREAASGGVKWTKDGVTVAASCPLKALPHGRHWLALRPKVEMRRVGWRWMRAQKQERGMCDGFLWKIVEGETCSECGAPPINSLCRAAYDKPAFEEFRRRK